MAGAGGPRRAPADAALDCTACGVCCWADEPDYIRIYAVDLARLDAAARALTEPREGYRVMAFVAGRCRALAVDAASGRCRCLIYPMRPDCCRWLESGSPLCRQLRDARLPHGPVPGRSGKGER